MKLCSAEISGVINHNCLSIHDTKLNTSVQNIFQNNKEKKLFLLKSNILDTIEIFVLDNSYLLANKKTINVITETCDYSPIKIKNNKYMVYFSESGEKNIYNNFDDCKKYFLP